MKKKGNQHTDALNKKKAAFDTAIEKYNTNPCYRWLEYCAGTIIIILQVVTCIALIKQYEHTAILATLSAIILAYFLSDFINGLTHLIMDNNTSYHTLIGPYAAIFHLHHHKITYQKKNILKIYFYESAHKFWLAFYLIALAIAQYQLPFLLNLVLVLIGVFSSLAELSHYWCHNLKKNNSMITLLQNNGILLSMTHHRLHHCHDNINYAFLNGSSDFILNKIAAYCCKGYKKHADLHVKKITS